MVRLRSFRGRAPKRDVDRRRERHLRGVDSRPLLGDHGAAALRFTRQFDGEFSFNAESDTRAETNKRYGEIVIPRLKLNYQFTKELALRQIVELQKTRFFDTDGLLASVSRTLSLDWLASYYVRPGTVVYLGYGTVLEGSTFESLRPGRSNARS